MKNNVALDQDLLLDDALRDAERAGQLARRAYADGIGRAGIRNGIVLDAHLHSQDAQAMAAALLATPGGVVGPSGDYPGGAGLSGAPAQPVTPRTEVTEGVSSPSVPASAPSAPGGAAPAIAVASESPTKATASAPGQTPGEKALAWAHENFADKGYKVGYQCNDMVSKAFNETGSKIPYSIKDIADSPHFEIIERADERTGDVAIVFHEDGSTSHIMFVDKSKEGFEFWSTSGSLPKKTGKVPTYMKDYHITHVDGKAAGAPNGKYIQFYRYRP